jgi:O-methyltransferase
LRKLVDFVLKPFGVRIERIRTDFSFHIPEIKEFEAEIISVGARYSMTTLERQWALVQALEHVHREGVAGDIVECGVWRGGNLIIAALMRERFGLSAQIWGYDTFEGMSAPTEADRALHYEEVAADTFEKTRRGEFSDWCYSAIDEVRTNIERHVPNADIRLVKGKVEDTLTDPKNLPERISILRLDTDWYESTKVELEILYPRLAPGGVLIIDDFGDWAGAKLAVEEYFKDRPVWLHRVDRACRLAVKPSSVDEI